MGLGLRDKRVEGSLGWCSTCPHLCPCTQLVGSLVCTSCPLPSASERENQKENKRQQKEFFVVSPTPGLQELLLGDKGQTRQPQHFTQDHVAGTPPAGAVRGTERCQLPEDAQHSSALRNLLI